MAVIVIRLPSNSSNLLACMGDCAITLRIGRQGNLVTGSAVYIQAAVVYYEYSSKTFSIEFIILPVTVLVCRFE